MSTLINIHLSGIRLEESLKVVEALVFEHAIEAARFNQSKAARLLGVSRGTLRAKLKEHFPGKFIDEEEL